MKDFSYHLQPACADSSDDLVNDAVALFTGETQGHMERWEYASPMFLNDPAAGSVHWANLVKYPGKYYLTEGDSSAIRWAVHQEKMVQAIQDIESVVELGPGSHDAILKKTIPFLKSCPKLKNYVAVDATVEQAFDAACTVHESLSVSAGSHGQNYLNSPMASLSQGKTALVMWGSSLGNINGFANESPLPKLVGILENFKVGLKPDDLMILCFDTESDEKRVLDAYSELSLRAQILSIVHLLKRDRHVTGQFDPRIWHHEPVWFSRARQCAHVIYPLFDQVLNISGQTIRVPAWTRFISNNSYKFSVPFMQTALIYAGLDVVAFLQNGPIAIAIAKKF